MLCFTSYDSVRLVKCCSSLSYFLPLSPPSLFPSLLPSFRASLYSFLPHSSPPFFPASFTPPLLSSLSIFPPPSFLPRFLPLLLLPSIFFLPFLFPSLLRVMISTTWTWPLMYNTTRQRHAQLAWNVVCTVIEECDLTELVAGEWDFLWQHLWSVQQFRSVHWTNPSFV